MATTNLDSADLKSVARDGLIHEDVMNKIWDISKVPLPLTDMIGSGSAGNEYKSWTQDTLSPPDPDNFVVDGSDATGNDTVTGVRVGNHHQISDKVVRVSYRANASDTIGRAKELSYQITRRQQELRRDVEAIQMLNQASVADNGDAIAGRVGGLPTWLATNTVNLTTPVGYDTATGLTVVPTATVDGIALTETAVRDVVESIFLQGGDPTVLMSVPGVIRKFSEYLFTSSARVATLMSDQGKSSEKATALGSVNVFVTDFGTLRLVPNRLQLKYDAVYADPSLTASFADVFILDPSYLDQCFIYGYKTDLLAKTGLAENRQMSVDWSLIVNTEKAHGIIASVDPTKDVTA